MENVTDRVRNPFDMRPPCESFVPGYGDANADVHVIGDNPGVHGGAETGVPFTRTEAGERIQAVLAAVGLLENPGDEPALANAYLSYLHACVPDGDPIESDYADLDRFFDAELRAITAHVLVPVGERPVRPVLGQCTTYPLEDLDGDAVHAREISSGGWLVVPAKDPSTWTEEDQQALVDTLRGVLARDYARESDLGRFLTGPDPYLVR
ncbi:MAG: uracil-DNA glycosylase family protein [Halanaeroarchaeum sp.]